jgi:hypothetical protein
MAESKHTPGPWPDPEYDNSDTSADQWWDVPGIARYIPREADAHLIAAAPDLLDALKHCVIERSEWLQEARAAIARATQ